MPSPPPRMSPLPASAEPLPSVRILNQVEEDPRLLSVFPRNTPECRIVTFAVHMGLSILETGASRRTLVDTGMRVLDRWGARGMRSRAVGAVSRTPNRQAMMNLVDDFLSKCRADSPNVILSNRVVGDASTERYTWYEPQNGHDFDPKRAALVFVNSTIVRNAIQAADRLDREELRKFLFLLGISVAHELVHMFVGYLSGDNEDDTPPTIGRYPPGTSGIGEAGMHWENVLFNGFVEAMYDSSNPLGASQAGIYYLTTPSARGRLLNRDWMLRMLRFGFDFPASTTGPEVNMRRLRPMEQLRPRSDYQMLSQVVTNHDRMMAYINNQPSICFRSSDIERLMEMVDNPRRVRRD
ncbi:hypothetical protein SAPIO_CDS0390 [Scedosporium apiospermum]|uniref:Uncharacterized protein n=1 Tax=Pseudallescheria apiosperma TaxID=563466 RepID=A0A084GGX1_PSEDA|nr:uncharacterized protein SAPIO_CDS0390 [Scedosporium apiospermum]KEZ46583.1 hypothetical protein SAPIO_CDS0390 [Scedosporium apiospermum]